MIISIQDVTKNDVYLVSQLTRELISELTGSSLSRDDFDARAQCVLSSIQSSGLIAYDAEKPVGLMMLTEATAIFAGGLYGIITELYVIPEYRSKSVAAQLLETAIRKARRQAWKRLEVGVPSQPEWNRSLKFYEANGFVVTGPRLRLIVN